MVDIELIRERNPLLETIERMTGQTARKQGSWHMLFCPFHDDGSKRSFAVNPDGTVWQCQGDCGGPARDVIEFVSRFKRISFLEAVAELGGKPMASEDEKQAWLSKRQEEANREAERQAAAHAKFQATEVWEKLHSQMGPAQRKWWEGRGVSNDWQDYWCLGWTPELWGYGSAFSIPFFDNPGVCKTMQYRLAKVGDAGKYRFTPDLGPAAFIARPDWKLNGAQVLVVEGGIKAMVAHDRGTLGKLQVVGIPSKNTDGGIAAQLKLASRVFILLDPDAWIAPKNASPDWEPYPLTLGKMIGDQARIVKFPAKIDDALLAGWLDSDRLRGLLKNQAGTVASYL